MAKYLLLATALSYCLTACVGQGVNDSKSPDPTEQAKIKRGKSLYSEMKCAICHGVDGRLDKKSEIVPDQRSHDALSQYITKTMPKLLAKPEDCVGQCADDIAAYIKSWTKQPPTSSSSSSGTIALECDDSTHENTPMRLLTARQYSQLIAQTFSPLTFELNSIEDKLPDDLSAAGFNNNGGARLSIEALKIYLEVAGSVATKIANEAENLLSCDTGSNSCINEFVEKYGKLLFRRDLSDEEINAYIDLAIDVDSNNKLKSVTQALLVSPFTLYQYEYSVNSRQLLSGEEIANKLAFLLWNQAPDQTLLNYAATGSLSTKEGIRQKAIEMLEDSRAIAGLDKFYEGWLGFDVEGPGEADKGQIGIDLEAAFKESQRFASYITLEQNGDYQDLITSRKAFVTDSITKNYGLPNNELSGKKYRDAFEVELDENRSGIITRLAFLMHGAEHDGSQPTIRGAFYRNNVLCQSFPTPGADVQDEFPVLPNDPTKTKVEKLKEYHLSVPACAGCHELLDPLGFGFEKFDQFGAYRTEYTLANGTTKDVDDEGIIHLVSDDPSDITGKFNGAVELSQLTANSSKAQSCFSEFWFRYAFNRYINENDRCASQKLAYEFSKRNYSLKELILAVVESNTFRYRNPE